LDPSSERDQVIDKAFEDKAVLALKAIPEKEDPSFIELPRVLKDKEGKEGSNFSVVRWLCDIFGGKVSHVNGGPLLYIL
jgi:hypothetical protein